MHPVEIHRIATYQLRCRTGAEVQLTCIWCEMQVRIWKPATTNCDHDSPTQQNNPLCPKTNLNKLQSNNKTASGFYPGVISLLCAASQLVISRLSEYINYSVKSGDAVLRGALTDLSFVSPNELLEHQLPLFTANFLITVVRIQKVNTKEEEQKRVNSCFTLKSECRMYSTPHRWAWNICLLCRPIQRCVYNDG